MQSVRNINNSFNRSTSLTQVTSNAPTSIINTSSNLIRSSTTTQSLFTSTHLKKEC
ncbi:MAG: hypothetical protein V4629_13700 [Pseudomonadota bacterium]